MILLKTSILLCIFGTLNSANVKVSPHVQRVLERGETTKVIVECSKTPESFKKVDNILKQISEASQSPATTRTGIITDLVQRQQDIVYSLLEEVILLLDELGVKFEVLWLSFEIFIPEATSQVIRRLVQIGIVVIIRHDSIVPHIPPQPPKSQVPTHDNETWDISLINARCDEIKCFGDDVVIGFLDSGARVTHEEIKDNWMGKDTPIGYLDGNLESCQPTDDISHGTHVVGSACGKNVGVAPSAKWIMCRSCIETGCSESSLKICMLWLSCPYECGDTSGTKTTKNCTLRPHVINNSWGGLLYKMTTEARYVYYEYVQYWNSLGIISIFAAGNQGQGCNSVSVMASYDIVFSVGAVDINGSLGYFSSIGPGWSSKPLTKDSISINSYSSTRCASQNSTLSFIKPTLVAPGVAINSSVPTNDTAYDVYDGTSMAAPHVTGVVALMLCANRIVKWNYKKAYEILTKTTDTSKIDLMGEGQNKDNPVHIQTNLLCNVLLSNIYNTYPNNMYGYGLVDACKAVAASKTLSVGSNLGWT